jgi:hypothetical protein
MLEQLRTVLDQVGQLVDADPAVRGGVVLGGVVTGLTAALLSLRRRKAPSARIVVHVDAPEGERVVVSLNDVDPSS